jgi:surfeit locus 1 family protein
MSIRRRRGHAVPLVLGLAAIALFLGLGVWQVRRRAWKLDLIAAVDRHLHAAPVPAPGPDGWGRIAPRDVYTRLSAAGRFDNNRETLVQALTERGPGYWVVTPLRTTSGFTLLVNRGFVPENKARLATRPLGEIAGPVRVTGLLRLSEPGGRFLRANQPAADRWFSRDVAAIARARRLGPVAPYFIDADATPNPGGLPVGGLTVIRFPNNHLGYAITWFGMAALTVWALFRLLRADRGA